MSVYGNAMQVLEQHGWTKGRMRNADGGCCLVGAIAQAVTGDAYSWSDEADAAIEVIERRLAGKGAITHWKDVASNGLPKDGKPLAATSWNDREERTLDDVMSLLRELDEEELADAG